MSLFDLNTTANNRRFPLTALLFAVAAALTLIGASTANAATFNQTLSNPISGATTKQTVAVTSTSASNKLTKITVTQPSGMNFSYPALGSTSDRCPGTSMPNALATFDPSSCPSQAKIGSITVNTGTQTATGDIYIINKLQTPWLGVDISPTTAPGNPSDLTLRFAFVSSWPQVDPTCNPNEDWCEQQMSLWSTSFGANTLVSASITFGGADRGSLPGDLFYVPFYNTCDSGFLVKGVLKSADNAITTTYDGDCPFAPTYGGTLSDTTAGALVGITWHWENQIGSSNIKRLGVDADPRLSPNIPAFGSSADQCTASAMPSSSAAFDVSYCPPQAKIGTFTLNSPDYSAPATGDIYIVNRSPVPWLAVKLTPSNVSLSLVPSIVQIDPTCDPTTDPSGYCPLRVHMEISGLPNVRTTSAEVSFNGPDRAGVDGPLSGKLFALPTDCATPLETTLKFTPFVGAQHSVTEQTALTGC